MKRLSFPPWIILELSLQITFLTTYVKVYFWTLYSVLFVSMSVILPVPHCFDYCSFFLLNWLPFVSFSCLIAMARSSNTIPGVASGFLVLFLILGRELCFNSEYNVNYRVFTGVIYHVEEVPFYFWFVEYFYCEKGVGCGQLCFFFLHQLRWSYGIFPLFF